MDEDLITFLGSLIDLRGNLFDLSDGMISWEPWGEDGLYGWMPSKQNLATKIPSEIAIFVNRSRDFWMPIRTYSSNHIFLVGEIDSQKKALAPQSIFCFWYTTGEG